MSVTISYSRLDELEHSIITRLEPKYAGEEAVEQVLDDIHHHLAQSPLDITEHESWDGLYSCILSYSDLTPTQKSSLISTFIATLTSLHPLSQSLQQQSGRDPELLQQQTILRSAYQLCIYGITQIISKQEMGNKADAMVAPTKTKAPKGKSKKSTPPPFDWSSLTHQLITSLLTTVRTSSMYACWSRSMPEQEYGASMMTIATTMMENQENCKNKTLKESLFHLFLITTHRFSLHDRATAALLHLLHHYEHTAIIIADLLYETTLSSCEQPCTQLIPMLLHELSRIDNNMMKQDSTGMKAIAIFLTELAARCPHWVLKYLSLIEPFLDGESYVLRNGIVSLIGHLLEKAFTIDDNGKQMKPPTSPEKSKSKKQKMKSKKPKNKKKKKNDESDEEISDYEEEDEEEQEEEEEQQDDISEPGEEKSPIMDDESTSQAMLQASRDKLYEMLMIRIHDVSTYTRSKVLQTWIELARTRTIPSSRLPSIVSLALDRLTDKNAAPRKYAVELLTTLLEFNPYASNLDVSQYQEKLKQEIELMAQHLGDRQAAAAAIDATEEKQEQPQTEDVKGEDDDEMIDAKPVAKRGKATILSKHDEEYTKKMLLAMEASDASLQSHRRELETVFTCVQFIDRIQQSIPIVCQLLASKTCSDVLECIRFFVIAQQFHISNAQEGVRKMLMLIWSRELPVREGVMNAYRQLYIGTLEDLKGAQQKKQALDVAKAWIQLTIGATLADMTSLEELLTKMMHQKMIPNVLIEALWDIFASKSGVTLSDRSSALTLLSMLGSVDTSILIPHIGTIITIGLQSTYPWLARISCMTLTKISHDDISKPILNVIYTKLRNLLISISTLSGVTSQQWYACAEQAIHALFRLHPKPEIIATEIIRTCVTHVTSSNIMDINNDKHTDHINLGSSERLSRLLFILGHIAVKTLVLLEETEKSLKKLKASTRSETIESKKALSEENYDSDDGGQIQLAHSGRVKKENKTEKKEKKSNGGVKKTAADAQRSAIEEELAVGASEEYELEQLRERAEQRLVEIHATNHEMTSILAIFAPIIVHIIMKPAKYISTSLQSSAVLCLCKYMCVNADFCDHHLQLLFTILKQSTSTHIRANVIIALGDMAFRFPNLIEPWSEHMYDGLRHTDVLVRKNTLMVLTHLILNDMLKAKGPIAEIAKCVHDQDVRIADLAKLFFQELSHKGKNPIYNILPEVISRLSADSTVTTQAFHHILRFLISYISKDRQVESLVEKLCHRFEYVHIETVVPQLLMTWGQEGKSETQPAAVAVVEKSQDGKEQQMKASIQQCRDVAYCLSQLQFTPAAIKRLCQPELFRCYANKLGDDEIYACFNTIIQKGRKFAKADMKSCLDELESKLQQQHDKLMEESQTNVNANTARGKIRPGMTIVLSDDEEKEENSENIPPTNVHVPVTKGKGRAAPAKRGRAAAAPAKRPAAAAKKGAAARPAARRGRRAVVEESASEEEEEEDDEEIEELSESD